MLRTSVNPENPMVGRRAIRSKGIWKKGLALLIVTLAVSLYLGEGLLRLVYDATPFPVYGARHPLGFEIAGHTIRVKQSEFDVSMTFNSFGYRDNEFPIPPSPEGNRVVFVGDSFVEGFGVEKAARMTERLQDLMNEEKSGNWRVVNLGQLATGPDSYFKNLVGLGLALRPNIVVMGLFLGNDFLSSKPLLPYRVVETVQLPPKNPVAPWLTLGFTRALVRQTADKLAKPLLVRPHREFALNPELPFWEIYYHQPITRNFFLAQTGLTSEQFDERCKTIDPVLVRDSMNGMCNPSFLIGAVKREGLPTSGTYYQAKDEERVFAHILECARILRERSVHFLVVIIPDAAQAVGAKEAERQRQRWGESGVPTRLREIAGIQARLISTLRSADVACLDLTPGFQTSTNAYYEEDTHLTPTGHRLAAESIFQRMLKEKWFVP